MATSTTDAPAVQSLGDYIIERELGRGAHGVVYRAHLRRDPSTPVALKVIESRGNLDQLMLEPAMLAKLNHPSIVQVQDYFIHTSQLVVAMEFIDGEDLKVCLERGDTFTQAEIRELLIQIGGALKEAHSKGIIHRDLKPANILVMRRPKGIRFVLTDFGIGQQDEGIQAKKHAGGTYFFMAPEQFRGRPGPQSDLWALGVTAYLLLTGRLPFPGPTLTELARQIQFATPTAPSSVCTDGVDSTLESVLMRLLDKSLTERVGSADELLKSLGYRGDSKTPPEKTTSTRATSRQQSLDRKLAKSIRSARTMMILCILIYYVPSGLIATSIFVLGLVYFYLAQAREKRNTLTTYFQTLLAFAMMLVSILFQHGAILSSLGFNFTLPFNDIRPLSVVQSTLFTWSTPLLSLLGVVGTIFLPFLGLFIGLAYVFLPLYASRYFATYRSLQREQVLRRAALEGETNSERYLALMRENVNFRFEDVGFHLKYAEALAAQGNHRQASVESRLLLEQDPYNFGGNLLLASSYYQLGLDEDCERVCDEYLNVVGYAFEFTDLKQQCLRGRALT